MTSFVARKISTRRSTLVVAATLLNCGAAFAADTVEDAQAQARALLSAAPVVRTDGISTALPGGDVSASVANPQDQARALLAGASRFQGAEVRTDGSASGADVTSAAAVGNQGTAYAGAQESARKMILGSGA